MELLVIGDSSKHQPIDVNFELENMKVTAKNNSVLAQTRLHVILPTQVPYFLMCLVLFLTTISQCLILICESQEFDS